MMRFWRPNTQNVVDAISGSGRFQRISIVTGIRLAEEIVGRLKRLQAGGVEYVMVIDVGGSFDHLRIFAREVMPEFAG